ncbi:2-amino-4-hydroxy-6-hydroxymethyldihydropteridine diphosphokinase [Paludibaculum fermentans]|uniref:2-amino-4-hydroxy-6-hydroxymethyldihydropteridine pyrophosphokinase n=1 Tax=Paludibaculum fermentans TaxID=1473598 RepID=A0A7S7NNS4_PALFE|nr:2-amino-4-hydroxy-6-hydroxymethyldihydropteridine diphosphokinase [Paludibaculum fermentans]QOY86504.1 2-amino-4-hydroxy-6-hydroxymethyldihydropteridine diphosphokinase [Paludibaculum fermentans]
MADVYLGLGSNIGDKAANLQAALARLAEFCAVLAVSSFHETDPVGYLDQDRFLNAAAHVSTHLEPAVFLTRLLETELSLGRVRTLVNGPRIIDLDILLWDRQVIDLPGLSVPHPRMHERLFVLDPLVELAPEAIHPRLGRTVRQLRETLLSRMV